MKQAFIFTGQGEDLAVNNPQLTTFFMSVALAKTLIANGIKPDTVAGLSLGEYAALAIAEVFSIEELEQILSFRQKVMDEALQNSDTGMIACIGLEAEKVEEIASQHGLVVTNYNSPIQTVVGGKKSDIELFRNALIKYENVSAVVLPVTGAFHSPYLKSASEEMRGFLAGFTAKDPKMPIYYNLTGEKKKVDIKDTIVEHMVSPVQFQETIENMLNDGVDTFISIGIGTAPVNLIRQIAKAHEKRVKVKKVETVDDIERLLK